MWIISFTFVTHKAADFRPNCCKLKFLNIKRFLITKINYYNYWSFLYKIIVPLAQSGEKVKFILLQKEKTINCVVKINTTMMIYSWKARFKLKTLKLTAYSSARSVLKKTNTLIPRVTNNCMVFDFFHLRQTSMYKFCYFKSQNYLDQ
jgi:uncharacterized membrane protein